MENKHIVTAEAVRKAHPDKLCDQIADAILDAHPNSYLAQLVRRVFDMRPAAIIQQLNLCRPCYSALAAYGHYGRPELDLP